MKIMTADNSQKVFPSSGAARHLLPVGEGRLRALIFDVDGTLADTERDGHRVAFNRAFVDAGLAWHWSVADYGELLRVTGGRERLLHFVRNHAPEITSPERETQVRRLHELKTEHYLRMIEHGAVQLRPGIARILGEAHAAGVALAIATTTTRANVDALLAHTLPGGAIDWFQIVGAAENAARKKPDPAIYEFVLDAMNLAPQDCLAIEDSEAGLCAALQADVPTVVTLNDYTDDQDFSGALAVLSDLGGPEAAATPIAGARLRHTYVDLDQLRAWHLSAQGRPRQRSS